MNSAAAWPARGLTLAAECAADLMTPNPLSIQADATVAEAVAFLTDRGFSGAPVIDEAGRPVGVLSRADILAHDRETPHYVAAVPEYYVGREPDVTPTLASGEKLPDGFQVERPDATRVRDIMTPVVFSVAPEAPAAKVVENLVSLKVHRLFVVDQSGALVGVISALDVLRGLGRDTRAPHPALSPGGRG